MPRGFACSERTAGVCADGDSASAGLAPAAADGHGSRRSAPDELGSFLARRVAGFEMGDGPVYERRVPRALFTTGRSSAVSGEAVGFQAVGLVQSRSGRHRRGGPRSRPGVVDVSDG